jgi:hypothetical protein
VVYAIFSIIDVPSDLDLPEEIPTEAKTRLKEAVKNLGNFIKKGKFVIVNPVSVHCSVEFEFVH